VNQKNIEDIYNLSPMQEGMLFHSIYAPNSGTYIEQVSVQIAGELNIPAFERAWQNIIERHSILRTAFVWEGVNSPLQVVGRSAQLPLSFHDWQPISQEQQQQQIETLLKAERDRGFELTKAPLMRLILIRLAENSYQFIWSHHHILLDGWSTSIVLNEVFICYQALCQEQEPNLPQPRPYRDYIAWLKVQSLSAAESFWREQLKGFSAPTKLGIDRGQIQPQSSNYSQEHLTLDAGTTSNLQTFTRQHQITLSTLVQAVWAILLSRYSGETDVIFGTTVSGRSPSLTGADEMVGLFINTLPVRGIFDLEQPLLPWLQQFQTQQAEIRQYEYTPLVEIQQWSEVPSGLPLFDSILVFENFPFNPEREQGNENLQISQAQIREQTNYPVTLIVKPGTELQLELLYDTERFEPDAIARMLQHFQTLLQSILTNPDRSISELPWLTDEEKQQILIEWNQESRRGAMHCAPGLSIVELFDLQAAKTPDAVAVVLGDSGCALTYAELNQKANELAVYLQSLGVIADSIVGICCDRSLEMVIGLLGILKAGGAYLPLDPSYPQERLAFMLEDANISILLTQESLSSQLPPTNAQLVYLSQIPNPYQFKQNSLLLTPYSLLLPSSSLAYVIYTSGSTGKPKGAMNTHRGISNRLLWMQDTYQLTSADRVLQKTPFSFDVSVWEFFWTLITGATLVMAKPGGHQDSGYLVELIQQQQITTVHFVPSMLEIFLQETGVEECKSLKRVICSGEALSFELQEWFFATFDDVELHNLYGPTEAAIDVTFWQCQREVRSQMQRRSTATSVQPEAMRCAPVVPIGRPIANTQIYILDRHLQPVPIGIPGELHIGGVGLARGYLNRPDLTEEKFIPNPFSEDPTSKLYKTGDLARYRSDGNIEFLGRIDYQVKIRGLRIELEEIEAVIQQYPGIDRAIVTVNADNLVAHILPNAQCPMPNAQSLREFLQQKLPEYMIPSAFIELKSLPLTSNGKLNRRALKDALGDTQIPKEIAKVLPRNSTEETLVNIWSQVLNLPDIGIYDNFFEVGGHSLRATQAISKIRQSFQLEVPLDLLFTQPTIADFAREIERLQTAATPALDSKVPVAVSRSAHRVKL
jgi:amino acid adenylation domain-containing protein